MDEEERVNNFWSRYQAFVTSQQDELEDDFIDLFDEGEHRPAGSHSLYFRPWGTDLAVPYFGYQTLLGQVVLYVRDEELQEQLRTYVRKHPNDLRYEKYDFQTTPTGTLKLILDCLQEIDIRIQDFSEEIAERSYMKVVALYGIARRAFPAYRH